LESAAEGAFSLSLNGGVDFSSPSKILQVLGSAVLKSATTERIESAESTFLILEMNTLQQKGSAYTCRVASVEDDFESFLPANILNDTHVACLDEPNLLSTLNSKAF